MEKNPPKSSKILSAISVSLWDGVWSVPRNCVCSSSTFWLRLGLEMISTLWTTMECPTTDLHVGVGHTNTLYNWYKAILTSYLAADCDALQCLLMPADFTITGFEHKLHLPANCITGEAAGTFPTFVERVFHFSSWTLEVTHLLRFCLALIAWNIPTKEWHWQKAILPKRRHKANGGQQSYSLQHALRVSGVHRPGKDG